MVILVNLGRRLHKVLNHRWRLLLRGRRLELLGHHHQVGLRRSLLLLHLLLLVYVRSIGLVMPAALAKLVGAGRVVGQIVCHCGVILLLIVTIRVRTLLVGHQIRVHAIGLLMLLLPFNVR